MTDDSYITECTDRLQDREVFSSSGRYRFKFQVGIFREGILEVEELQIRQMHFVPYIIDPNHEKISIVRVNFSVVPDLSEQKILELPPDELLLALEQL